MTAEILSLPRPTIADPSLPIVQIANLSIAPGAFRLHGDIIVGGRAVPFKADRESMSFEDCDLDAGMAFDFVYDGYEDCEDLPFDFDMLVGHIRFVIAMALESVEQIARAAFAPVAVDVAGRLNSDPALFAA